MDRILKCRTSALGGHEWTCECGHKKNIYNSCNNRSCPQCSWHQINLWTEKRLKKVIERDHFHVVFTIPEEINRLWLKNSSLMAYILFESVKDTIKVFSHDIRYIGAKTGSILNLHTWGQNMSLHPHIHCLITAGGINENGNWINSKGEYLFPVKAMKKYFRGKFLIILKNYAKTFNDEIAILNMIDMLFDKEWNVFIKEKYSHAEGVIKYLARYVKGGPIKDSRIVNFNDKNVTFRYKDYRDNKEKIMTLSMKVFIQRLLLHIPPSRFKTIRYIGLYSPQSFKKYYSLLKKYDLETELKNKSEIYKPEICPACRTIMKGPTRLLPEKHIKLIRPPPLCAA